MNLAKFDKPDEVITKLAFALRGGLYLLWIQYNHLDIEYFVHSKFRTEDTKHNVIVVCDLWDGLSTIIEVKEVQRLWGSSPSVKWARKVSESMKAFLA